MTSALVLLASALETPAAWWSPYLPVAKRVLRAAGSSQSVVAALNASRGASGDSLRFAEHSALPTGEAYEAFIARTACVPTRDNLHDLFNGLMWLSYPQTKRRLNALQAQQIALHGTSGPRGPLRDAMTLFDENAAVLKAPPVLVDALRRRDWGALFLEHRRHWESARLVVFGHALLEKLLTPRKPITAHVWAVDELTDDGLAESLSHERLTAKAFWPLPVLGVPGWWSANEAPGFYEDAEVFRRPASASTRYPRSVP
jgi:hypothetical protein